MKIAYADLDGKVAGFHELHEGQHVRLNTTPWAPTNFPLKRKSYPKALIYKDWGDEVLASNLPREHRLRPPPGYQDAFFQSLDDGKIVREFKTCPMLIGTLVRSDRLTKRTGWKRPGYGSQFSEPYVQEHEAWMAEHPELVLELVTGEIIWLSDDPMYAYAIDYDTGEKRLVINPDCKSLLTEHSVTILEEKPTVADLNALAAMIKITSAKEVVASYTREIRKEGGMKVSETEWQYEEATC